MIHYVELNVTREIAQAQKLTQRLFGLLLETKIMLGHLPIYLRTQPAFNCSKLTIKKLEQGVKYVQS